MRVVEQQYKQFRSVVPFIGETTFGRAYVAFCCTRPQVTVSHMGVMRCPLFQFCIQSIGFYNGAALSDL